MSNTEIALLGKVQEAVAHLRRSRRHPSRYRGGVQVAGGAIGSLAQVAIRQIADGEHVPPNVLQALSDAVNEWIGVAARMRVGGDDAGDPP